MQSNADSTALKQALEQAQHLLEQSRGRCAEVILIEGTGGFWIDSSHSKAMPIIDINNIVNSKLCTQKH